MKPGTAIYRNPAANASAKGRIPFAGAAQNTPQSPDTEANRGARSTATHAGATARRARMAKSPTRAGFVCRHGKGRDQSQRHVTEESRRNQARHRARCGCCHHQHQEPDAGRAVIVIGVGMLRRASSSCECACHHSTSFSMTKNTPSPTTITRPISCALEGRPFHRLR